MNTDTDMLSLLIFELDGARFGLDATAVLESVWLPELTPIDELPPWVVGMFSLRGTIVPVIDLHLRFGHTTRPYRISDQIVVLKTDSYPIGFIVSEVIEVIELQACAIQPCPDFDASQHGVSHLATGIAGIGDELVTLLDTRRLPNLFESLPLKDLAEQSEPKADLYAQTPPEVSQLLRKRAIALRQSPAEREVNRIGLAIVELNGEYFGIELTTVQEFCNVSQLAPIPCCPPHILGVMNLRGSLLTLIDPRSALNLAPAAIGNKAVIALFGEQLIGIAVDQIHEVVYLRNEQIRISPAMLMQYNTEIAGIAAYGDKTMTILDLPALLRREDWLVNENV